MKMVNGPNQCLLKEGTGPLLRCQYQKDDWNMMELSCQNDTDRTHAVSGLRFSDESGSTEVINNRTRVVSATIDL
jgi:hypothetical protein